MISIEQVIVDYFKTIGWLAIPGTAEIIDNRLAMSNWRFGNEVGHEYLKYEWCDGLIKYMNSYGWNLANSVSFGDSYVPR